MKHLLRRQTGKKAEASANCWKPESRLLLGIRMANTFARTPTKLAWTFGSGISIEVFAAVGCGGRTEGDILSVKNSRPAQIKSAGDPVLHRDLLAVLMSHAQGS
jgi:hypothetical protein